MEQVTSFGIDLPTDGSKLDRCHAQTRVHWDRPSAGVPLCVWALLYVNPLPRDEEMISHLRKHRTEIEALVNHYRTYQRGHGTSVDWRDLPDVTALREKSHIARVTQAGPVWLPHPYSAQTARHLNLLAPNSG
jgi:hypothetical protein